MKCFKCGGHITTADISYVQTGLCSSCRFDAGAQATTPHPDTAALARLREKVRGVMPFLARVENAYEYSASVPPCNADIAAIKALKQEAGNE